MSPSSRGLGHRVFIPATRVRIPLEMPFQSGRLAQLARALLSHGRGHEFKSRAAHHFYASSMVYAIIPIAFPQGLLQGLCPKNGVSLWVPISWGGVCGNLRPRFLPYGKFTVLRRFVP